jgi:hypothetical protein
MLTHVIIIALISAFVILFITKVGLRDFVIEQGPKLISKMFNCDFCLSFWTNVFVAFFIAAFLGFLPLMVVPIFATPITRILI